MAIDDQNLITSTGLSQQKTYYLEALTILTFFVKQQKILLRGLKGKNHQMLST